LLQITQAKRINKMTIKNADKPAMPNTTWDNDLSQVIDQGNGFTKREKFCLAMGVAETGDEELDAIIRKGNKQKATAMAMQGLLAGGYCIDDPANRLNDVSSEAVGIADVLFAELEQAK
jgi:hypothetical protein